MVRIDSDADHSAWHARILIDDTSNLLNITASLTHIATIINATGFLFSLTLFSWFCFSLPPSCFELIYTISENYLPIITALSLPEHLSSRQIDITTWRQQQATGSTRLNIRAKRNERFRQVSRQHFVSSYSPMMFLPIVWKE